MTTTETNATHARTAGVAAWIGLALTLIVGVVPFLEPATQVLTDHIRSGYPGYTEAEVDDAVGSWQIVLTVLSVLGVLAWAWTIRSVRTARWSTTALFTVAVCIALALHTVRDTSGEVGLAPALAWLWTLPCVAGAAVTVATWRRCAPGAS